MEQQLITSADIVGTTGIGNNDDAVFKDFLTKVQARFDANTANKPIFTTDVEPDAQWDAYLDSIPTSDRQYHNCSCCRHFIKTYGGLATINDNGSITSAIWNEDDAPDYYKKALNLMAKNVRRANVTGVFITSETMLGAKQTGIWTHFAIKPSVVHRDRLKTAYQAMAEKKEDFRNVSRALAEFNPATITTALNLLQSDSLYRSEKVIGPAQWLFDLHTARDTQVGKQKDNKVWQAIATAPAGFAHPKSSMVGTLLEDLASGLDYETVSKRFKAKMHPLQYQRPQAVPSVGNIEAAEKIVEKLGIKNSLKRRFATLSDIRSMWVPAAPKDEVIDAGVFGHLKAKSKADSIANIIAPAGNITFEKFTRTVLPNALSMELFTKSYGTDNYCAYVTAADETAPPIIQWDNEEVRNPVTWYVYNGGSTAERWSLRSGSWTPVVSIAQKPFMWYEGNYSHHGNGALFVLAGAKDTCNNSMALFPEHLKSDLHPIRSTIEAYSRSGKLGMPEGDQQLASGLIIADDKQFTPVRVRVKTAIGTQEYTIDRMD